MLDDNNIMAWINRGHAHTDSPLSIPISEIESRQPQWLLEGLIPKGVPTLLCGDGGCGKSTMALSVASAISRGDRTFDGLGPGRALDSGNGTVLILSNEDDPHTVIRPRLDLMRANCEKIHLAKIDNELNYTNIDIGSQQFRHLLEDLNPHLLIIDPLQSFVPDGTNMNSKREMRRILQSLIDVGTTLGITTIVIAHTNKRLGVGGSYRIADSSEIRNACRNVLIIGEAEPGMLYCDHNKCNVGPRSSTILFSYDSNRCPVFRGFSDCTDFDFQKQRLQSNSPSQFNRASELIISTLQQRGTLSSEELQKIVTGDNSVKTRTYQRARAELIKNSRIRMCRDSEKHTSYSLDED